MSRRVHIVGGGIIGLTSAYYLQREGCEVVIVDKSDMKDGTSHGNAGMIVPSHFVPMSAPGVIKQGIKWMFDSKSPFYVKPRVSLDLLRWSVQFYKSCNVQHVENSMPILYEFNEWSKQLYKEFSDDPAFDFCFEEKGLLMLYKTAKQESEEKELAEHAHELGLDAKIFSAKELKELEPDIKLDVRGGIYFPQDAHLYPNKFIAQLKTLLKARGARFEARKEVLDFNTSNDVVVQIRYDDGSVEDVDKLVIASGSWTPYLLKKLKVRMLLQDGKGYSFTINNPAQRPAIPTILAEAKVAVTPMGEDLRIGGTLELGGMSNMVNMTRLQGIVESVPRYYPNLKIEMPKLEQVWSGYRPCTPDGLPYIGTLPGKTNVTIATGHGMMGMSMGPATGKLVSEMITDKKTSLNIERFKVDRKFGN